MRHVHLLLVISELIDSTCMGVSAQHVFRPQCQVVYLQYTPPNHDMYMTYMYMYVYIYIYIYIYICWAQSMDLRNPWIALHEAWIRALRDDPWIVCSIRGLRNSVCAKYRFASDPRLSPRLLWICIAFITVIASIIK